MTAKPEPWYIHTSLYIVIAILVIVLVKVAILDPKDIVQSEKFNKKESRLRMQNIKIAEIIWQEKYKTYSGNLDTLIDFIKNDPTVDSLINGFDTVIQRSSNPFKPLSNGEFVADSLLRTPKSQQLYILQIDTSISIDTVTNRYGKIRRVDTNRVIGTKYFLKDPDGYGTIGSLEDDALKNTTSWD